MIQEDTPLLDTILEYAEKGIIRFHMPGHKGGYGAHPRLLEALGPKALRMDVTGVNGMDDLHQPSEAICHAQNLAARLFGADHTFFLVNGTSVGVQAMILATCQPGDRVVVPRNIHKSILSGIILSGAIPVYIQPEVDHYLGIAMGISPERFEQALKLHPDAAAAVVINPTYYGVTSDIQALTSLAHHHGIPLLVDEAHGPHLHFHPALPPSALDVGADACAHGIHKILSGLTQASMLHLRGDRISHERVKAVLRLLQSTSASYLLLASLDAARYQMAVSGRGLVERAMALAEEFRARVNDINGLYAFGKELLGEPGIHGLDPTKVTVTVRELGISGLQAETILRQRYGIQVELSDPFNILFIVGYGNTHEDILTATRALEDMAANAPRYRDDAIFSLVMQAGRDELLAPPLPETVLSPREAFFAPFRPVSLERAAGGVCTEVITCYPPGIPIICPGERFSPEIIDYLKLIKWLGLRVCGPEDPSLETVRVLA